jgi:HD domain
MNSRLCHSGPCDKMSTAQCDILSGRLRETTSGKGRQAALDGWRRRRTIWADMTSEEFTCIQKRFHAYVNGFAEEGCALHPLLQLKADHCERVATEAKALSADLGWPCSEQRAAEALGLLHDVGRFSQYADYGTFSDVMSVDHGLRGWEVVHQEGWLASWAPEERERMLDGIRHHNGRTIPETLSEQSLAMVCLIRDADKLDIFEVVLSEVQRDGFQDLPKMLPHLTLGRTPTPERVREIRGQRNASSRDIRTLADFLLLQLSWVYTMNYVPTIRRFHERDLCDRIFSLLEVDAEAEAFRADIDAYVETRLAGNPDPMG